MLRVFGVLVVVSLMLLIPGVAVADASYHLHPVSTGCTNNNVWLGSSHPTWDCVNAADHVSDATDSTWFTEYLSASWGAGFNFEDLDDEQDIGSVNLTVRAKGTASVYFYVKVTVGNESDTYGPQYTWGYPSYHDFVFELEDVPGGSGWTDEQISAVFVEVYGPHIPGYVEPFISHMSIDVVMSDEHGAPVGSNPGAGDIQDYTADLRGYCIWDGNPESGDTTAVFYWYDQWNQEGNITYSTDIDSGEYFSVELTTVPVTTYSYWFVMSNVHGNYTSPLTYFTTEEGTTGQIPTVLSVLTEAMWRDDIEGYPEGTGWVNFVGKVIDDGGQNCLWGFAWREVGGETWLEVEFDEGGQYRNTGETFAQNVVGFEKNTSYEWKARARNSLGIGYGAVKTFGIGSVPGVPVPSPSPGVPNVPLIPDDWGEWLEGLGSIGLALLGIVITIVSCLGVARFRGGTIVVLITAVGLTVGFTVLGWYPGWIILLTAVALGLGLFFMLNRGH